MMWVKMHDLHHQMCFRALTLGLIKYSTHGGWFADIDYDGAFLGEFTTKTRSLRKAKEEALRLAARKLHQTGDDMKSVAFKLSGEK